MENPFLQSHIVENGIKGFNTGQMRLESCLKLNQKLNIQDFCNFFSNLNAKYDMQLMGFRSICVKSSEDIHIEEIS